MDIYDVAVIGSGPAGLAAAVNLSIRGKRMLFFGTDNLSSKLAAAPVIDNYLGLPGISGHEFVRRCREHLEHMGIEMINEQVISVYNMEDSYTLATKQSIHEAITVILATGAVPTDLLPGEERLLGNGVGYCATCDAPLFRGKTVAVLGFNDEAVLEADFVAKHAKTVYYAAMKKSDKPLREGVIPLNGPVLEILGDRKAVAIKTAEQTIPVDGVFVLRESIAHTSLAPGIAIENGFIVTDAEMRTNLPGCYAAGDCTGKPHQIMRAVGQGQIAAFSAVTYIDNYQERWV